MVLGYKKVDALPASTFSAYLLLLYPCRHVGGSGQLQPLHSAQGLQLRRVAILRALLAEYDLLFLDEPFKGLNQETKEIVMADTRRRCAGRTVLFVTHDPAELEALGAGQRLELS